MSAKTRDDYNREALISNLWSVYNSPIKPSQRLIYGRRYALHFASGKELASKEIETVTNLALKMYSQKSEDFSSFVEQCFKKPDETEVTETNSKPQRFSQRMRSESMTTLNNLVQTSSTLGKSLSNLFSSTSKE